MGYTHYWRVAVDVDARKLATAQWDMALLVRAARVPLANGLGEPGTAPQIEEGEILFNGVAPQEHETFVWPPRFGERFPDWTSGETWETPVRHGPLTHSRTRIGGREFGFAFCKTARKPYDCVVAACLLAAKDRLGEEVRIASDGTLEEFLHGAGSPSPETGLELYRRVLGRDPIPDPFRGSDEWDEDPREVVT